MDAGTETCVGCGAIVPRLEGPIHRYMTSAPGCWALFGELLADLLSDPEAEDLRRRCADAFAVQHPGSPADTAMQSVAAHLISLYTQFELGLTPTQAHEAIEPVLRHEAPLRWLEPPLFKGPITVGDVVREREGRNEAAVAWARGAWMAWSPWHAQVRAWHMELCSDG